MFHVGDVVSAGTGFLVSPRGMAGVYVILNFMSGDSICTNQIPRVREEASLALLQQHPNLGETFAETRLINQDNWQDWLDVWIARHGETMMVLPMEADQHERIDALSELAQTVHPDQILRIDAL